MSEWMNARMNEWPPQWMNECMNEWASRWMAKSLNEWVIDCPTDWLDECLNEWISGWLNEWLSEWMPEPTSEWRNGGDNDLEITENTMVRVRNIGCPVCRFVSASPKWSGANHHTVPFQAGRDTRHFESSWSISITAEKRLGVARALDREWF
jgi:hypothetical protein